MNTAPSLHPSGKQRLWVISELYYPEMTSTGYYLTKIAEGLAPDFDVNVICGQPNYSAKGTTAPKRERINNVNIIRTFGTRLDKNVIPFKALNMLTLGISVFVHSLLRFKRRDKVLVVTTPPVTPFLTSLAARIKGSEHILLIHDCYPEILYAAKKLDEKSLFARFLENMSRRLIRNANGLIAVGRDMKFRLLEKSNENTDCHVIPNWAELDSVSPAPRESNVLLQELGLKEKLVLLYAGNMGYPNDIETFVEAAGEIESKDPMIHFVFLGAGVKKESLINAVKLNDLNNVTVLDSRPRSDQQVFLNACDVGIVSLVEKMKGVSMPSRTYNILAAGKPILALCDPDSEIAMVLNEEDAGWAIEPGNKDMLVAVVLKISAQSEELTRLGENARNAAVEKYSLAKAIESYRKALIP